MKRSTLLILSCGIFFVFTEQLGAQRIGNDEVYRMITALIESYKYSQSSLEKVKSGTTQIEDDPLSIELMLGLRLANKELDRAAKIIYPFNSSKDEKIQICASSAYQAYTTLQIHNNSFIDLFEKMGNDALTGDFKLGTTASRISEIAADIDEAWKLVMLSAVAATHSMVDLSGNPDEKLSRLRLTSSQRDILGKSLLDSFGPSIKEGMKAGQISLVAAAATIYSFVSDKNWKSSDSK